MNKLSDEEEEEVDDDDEDTDDATNEEDMENVPIYTAEWFKRTVSLWEVFVDITFIRDQWFRYKPEDVLKTNSFKKLKEILHLYRPVAQPWNEEEFKYCDLMVTAALVRRIELPQLRAEGYFNDAHIRLGAKWPSLPRLILYQLRAHLWVLTPLREDSYPLDGAG